MNINLFHYLTSFFKKALNIFCDLIYKKKCIQCGCSINEGILCKTCSKTVQNLSCFAQGKINGYSLYSCFYYEGVIQTLIHELKFKHNKNCAYYAAKYLSEFLNKIKDYEKNITEFKNPIIIPVLTHKINKNKRGYDNVYEIAKELSKETGYSLNDSALKRVKFTEAQYKLHYKKRKKNVEGAFELDKNFKTESLVILLDDIVTTGSTLEYITSLFKENGINNLICLTLSKTKYKKSF